MKFKECRPPDKFSKQRTKSDTEIVSQNKEKPKPDLSYLQAEDFFIEQVLVQCKSDQLDKHEGEYGSEQQRSTPSSLLVQKMGSLIKGVSASEDSSDELGDDEIERQYQKMKAKEFSSQAFNFSYVKSTGIQRQVQKRPIQEVEKRISNISMAIEAAFYSAKFSTTDLKADSILSLKNFMDHLSKRQQNIQLIYQSQGILFRLQIYELIAQFLKLGIDQSSGKYNIYMKQFTTMFLTIIKQGKVVFSKYASRILQISFKDLFLREEVLSKVSGFLENCFFNIKFAKGQYFEKILEQLNTLLMINRGEIIDNIKPNFSKMSIDFSYFHYDRIRKHNLKKTFPVQISICYEQCLKNQIKDESAVECILRNAIIYFYRHCFPNLKLNNITLESMSSFLTERYQSLSFKYITLPQKKSLRDILKLLCRLIFSRRAPVIILIQLNKRIYHLLTFDNEKFYMRLNGQQICKSADDFYKEIRQTYISEEQCRRLLQRNPSDLYIRRAAQARQASYLPLL